MKDYKSSSAGWFAADVLGELGTSAAPAVPELTRSLDHRGTSRDYEFMMAERAAIALFKLSPLGPEHAAELLKRLDSLSGTSLSYTALAILQSQPESTPASEALALVLSAELFDPAAVALIEIDKLPIRLFDLKVLLPALEKCSQSPNREVGERASKQHERFGKSQSKKGS